MILSQVLSNCGRIAKRVALAATAASLVGGSLLYGAGTAEAAGSVTITPPADRVLYEDCYDYTYSYAVAAPSSDWTVDVEITDPFGAHESSDFLYDGEPSAGTGTLFLCGGIDRPGTYTFSSTLTWYDASYNKYVEPTTSAQFTLGKPATQTNMRASTTRPAYNSRVTFTSKSTIQGRLAYARMEYDKVRLEAYLSGAWRKIQTTTMDGDGIAKFRYRWNTHRPRVKMRTVTLGNATWRASHSDPIVIKVQ